MSHSVDRRRIAEALEDIDDRVHGWELDVRSGYLPEGMLGNGPG